MATHSTINALYREVTRAAFLGLIINLSLGVVKLIGGLWGHSFALIADAVNSFGDVITTVVVLVALRLSQRPPNDHHPYGHSRAEGIAATNVALIVILSAIGIGWEAITRLPDQHDIPELWTLWIAGSNAVIKECLYQYNCYVGRRTGSAAIVANAWDHRSDALCSVAVLVGLVVIRIGGPPFAWADEVASLIVAAAIVWSGIALFRKSGSELMDRQAEREFVDEIRKVAMSVPEVMDVETLWVRKSGLEYFADIHIEVDAQMTVAEGHRIGHLVKDKLLNSFLALRDILVHLEPHGHKRLHQMDHQS